MIETKVINPEDEYEIVKASLKNPREFKLLYDMHYHSVFLFVNNRINDVNVTAEIVSDVFYKAITKLNSFVFKGVSIKSWLYKISYNELMMYYRNHKKDRTISIESESVIVLADECENENLRDINGLKKALDQLNDEELSIIEMKFFEKLSHREIAELLEISESNAKVKMHRAMTKLRSSIIK